MIQRKHASRRSTALFLILIALSAPAWVPWLSAELNPPAKTLPTQQPDSSRLEITEATGKLRPLLDPAKVLRQRTAPTGDRYNKIMVWLYELERAGGNIPNALDEVLPPTDMVENLIGYDKQLWRTEIFHQYRIAKDTYGIFNDPANLERMKRGRSPTIQTGRYAGRLAHVDHIIFESQAPSLAYNPANLRYLPDQLNLRRGDRPDRDYTVQIEKFTKFSNWDGSEIQKPALEASD